MRVFVAGGTGVIGRRLVPQFGGPTAGADALFWVDPPSDAADPIAEYARFGAIAARAITTNGIARTVFQSSIGAEKRHGAGEIDGLARTEELPDASGA